MVSISTYIMYATLFIEACCRPRLLHLEGPMFDDASSTMSSSLYSELGHDQHENDVLEGAPHSDEHQIELDTDRSFVLYPVGERALSVCGVL